ncbi:hypothetical protein N0V92_000248 [Colletotrichum tropicale]|nr:hypothetical protein N0V92_000248 [Colletotrichum tropicale]
MSDPRSYYKLGVDSHMSGTPGARSHDSVPNVSLNEIDWYNSKFRANDLRQEVAQRGIDDTTPNGKKPTMDDNRAALFASELALDSLAEDAKNDVLRYSLWLTKQKAQQLKDIVEKTGDAPGSTKAMNHRIALRACFRSHGSMPSPVPKDRLHLPFDGASSEASSIRSDSSVRPARTHASYEAQGLGLGLTKASTPAATQVLQNTQSSGSPRYKRGLNASIHSPPNLSSQKLYNQRPASAVESAGAEIFFMKSQLIQIANVAIAKWPEEFDLRTKGSSCEAWSILRGISDAVERKRASAEQTDANVSSARVAVSKAVTDLENLRDREETDIARLLRRAALYPEFRNITTENTCVDDDGYESEL